MEQGCSKKREAEEIVHGGEKIQGNEDMLYNIL